MSLRCLWLVCLWASLASVLAQTGTNLALLQPINGTGPTWPGYPPSNLTDGDRSTFTHPEADTAVQGYYFQVDLGQSFSLDHIDLFSRADGCCPERLTGYRVEVYADRGGETGTLNWAANFRMDGSFPPSGGSDTIRATSDANGTFSGRFVRILNQSGAPYAPQLAEIEVYGAPGPRILQFEGDEDVLQAGQSTRLRWRTDGATRVTLEPSPGDVGTNGTWTVQPTTTTRYTLRASSASGTTTAEWTLGVGVTLKAPEITEFLADNRKGLTDDDGDASDWIELRNPIPYRLNLEGYHLTDDPAQPTRWRLPAVRIPAWGRCLVFASGKDHRDPAAPLHANFKLSAGGDTLSLIAPDGKTVIQQIPSDPTTTPTYPPQRPDISYGLGTNGLWGYFRTPTPGETNGTSFAGIVADTTFSVDRGFHEAPVSIAITTKTPGTLIRYTLDRSTPSLTNGLTYKGPITLSNTTTLRAAAFREGWSPTDVDTHTHLFATDILASPLMRTSITKDPVFAPQLRAALTDLPSISLSTRETINDTTEVRTAFEWIRPDGKPGIHEDCGIQRFGGAFTDFAKKSFRLYFRAQYGAAKLKHPLFEGFDRGWAPTDEFDQLELRSCSHDMAMRGFYLSNPVTDDTLLEMGHLNPHGRFVHLYLNGQYWGVYHLRERWGASMHRRYLGGSKDDYESINGNWNVGGWADPGTPYDGDGSTWKRIKSLRGSYREVRPWLDVPQYVDYMLMWMFGGSEDEYRAVGPTVPGGGMKFLLNDADGWFCGPWYCAADDRTQRNSAARGPGDGPGGLLSKLVAEGDPEFRTLLGDHIHRALFNGGSLTPERMIARLQARADELARPFLTESARWNYLTPAVWAQRRDYARTNWLTRRTSEVTSQWRSAGFYPSVTAPRLTVTGGVVSNGFALALAGPTTGTVLYTTDGSDPRLPGGAESPKAQTYGTGQTTVPLVPAGSLWRWHTDEAGLGSSAAVAGTGAWSVNNWKHPDFTDSGWSEGPAQLGYGEGDEATVLPFGPNASQKWVSAYFRKRFAVPAGPAVTGLQLRLKCDDGAIVYLDGREIARSSMPTGTVLAATLATNPSDDGQGFVEIPLDIGSLAAGNHVLAVELHQSAVTSSDASFDLELTATVAGGAVGGTLPVLDRSTWVRLRARSGSTWSALNEAFFQVGPDPVSAGEIVFSQLNIQPSGPGDTEYVELLNVSARTVNLRGCRFTDGIEFAFAPDRDWLMAPGDRRVLVRDVFGFRQRFGIDVPVTGVYRGSLNNGGETLVLSDARGTVLCTAAYDRAEGWPQAAGPGWTLVRADPTRPTSDPLAWRVSSLPEGTPGSTDARPFNGVAAADPDGDGFPDLVEYALGSNPNDPASPDGGLPGIDASGRIVLQLERDLRAEDAVLTVEVSSDLHTWVLATRWSQQALGEGRARESWGRTSAAPGIPTFLRLTARTVVPR